MSSNKGDQPPPADETDSSANAPGESEAQKSADIKPPTATGPGTSSTDAAVDEPIIVTGG